jgi:hypothetical protein
MSISSVTHISGLAGGRLPLIRCFLTEQTMNKSYMSNFSNASRIAERFITADERGGSFTHIGSRVARVFNTAFSENYAWLFPVIWL